MRVLCSSSNLVLLFLSERCLVEQLRPSWVVSSGWEYCRVAGLGSGEFGLGEALVVAEATESLVVLLRLLRKPFCGCCVDRMKLQSRWQNPFALESWLLN